MIVPSPSKVLKNDVKILLKILQEPIGWLNLVLPRSHKILSKILLKILQEPIG